MSVTVHKGDKPIVDLLSDLDDEDHFSDTYGIDFKNPTSPVLNGKEPLKSTQAFDSRRSQVVAKCIAEDQLLALARGSNLSQERFFSTDANVAANLDQLDVGP